MDTPALEILRTQREDLARRVQSIDDAIARLESRATNRVRTAAPAGVASQARGKARSSNRDRSTSRTRQGQAQQAPATPGETAAEPASAAPATPAPLKDAVAAMLNAAPNGMAAKDIAAALTAQGRQTSVNTVLSTLSRLRGQRQAEKREGGRWFAAG